MSPDDFTEDSPGELVKTTFREPLPTGDYRDVTGLGFVPALLPPSLNPASMMVQLYDAVMEAERSLSLLEGVASRVENPALLISPFQYREARLSSAIENTFASAQQMALFNVDPSTVEEPKRNDVQEVNNYVRALQHGFRAEEPICLRLVRDLHKLLLTGIERRAGVPGEFRTSQNAIARAGMTFESAKFVPPPHTHLPDLLNNWERFVHAKDSGFPDWSVSQCSITSLSASTRLTMATGESVGY